MSQIIPLTCDPDQILQVAVVVNGVTINLQLEVYFNEIAGYWVMRISDPTTGNMIIDSIPLLCGNYPAGNLLGQFEYLGIGSAYVINATGTTDSDSPTDTNLGTDFVLVWSDGQSYVAPSVTS